LKQIRKRLTYANVMSSIAVFLVVGGATAFAAGHLGKNTVGTKQLKANSVTAAKLKKNSVTGQKVKDGSLTGTDINLSTLGTVPSAHTATSAGTANSATTAGSLSGRTPFALYTGAGLREIANVGPFTIKASCEIDVSGDDFAELQLTTSENNSAMDDNSGDEFDVFDTGEVAELISESDSTGEPNIEAGDGEFTAVAPDGTVIAFDNQAVGVNLAGHGGQCFFSGILEKLA
jgi:hypothetical protein